MHEDHEMIPLIINSLRQDLESRSEVNVSLALAAVCNIGGKSMAESLTPVVQRLLVSAASSPMIKKKAAMCMLRLQQKFPAIVSPDEWRNQLNEMISEPDLGIMTAYMSFLNALAKSSPEPYAFLYAKVVGCMSKVRPCPIYFYLSPLRTHLTLTRRSWWASDSHAITSTTACRVPGCRSSVSSSCNTIQRHRTRSCSDNCTTFSRASLRVRTA